MSAPAPLAPAHKRETGEPWEQERPFPTWLVLAMMTFTAWGGWYVGFYSGGFRADVYDIVLPGAPSSAVGPPRVIDPLVLGPRVYRNCSACHQEQGQGLSGTYPALAGSTRVAGPPETLIALLLHGQQGPLLTATGLYNGNMPAWPQLSDAELAAVLTYVRSSWNNAGSAISPALVANVREQTSTRSTPWNAEELDALVLEAPEGSAGRRYE
jgi:mono/diheme cytochrome c family protein